MKAVFIDQPGPPGAIRFGDLPQPALGPRDLLVRLHAAAANPVDTYIRSGKVPMALPAPFILGRDGAGVVEAVGDEVKRFRPGDRVWTNAMGIHGRQGTFAEYAAIPEEIAFPLHGQLGFLEIMAVAHSGLTAALGFLRLGKLPDEPAVLVWGAAGNVGRAVTAYAAFHGGRVIGVVRRPEDVPKVLDAGAQAALLAPADPFQLRQHAPQGMDVYWDTTGHHDFDLAVNLLRRGGRIVVMAGLGARPALPVGPLYVRDLSVIGFAVTYASPQELQICSRQIIQLLTAGKLAAPVGLKLPLASAAESHRLIEAGQAPRGKILIEIA